MKEKLSKADQLLAQFREAGKIVPLHESEHKQAIQSLNTLLEKVRRDYKIKERNSLERSSKTILTE